MKERTFLNHKGASVNWQRHWSHQMSCRELYRRHILKVAPKSPRLPYSNQDRLGILHWHFTSNSVGGQAGRAISGHYRMKEKAPQDLDISKKPQCFFPVYKAQGLQLGYVLASATVILPSQLQLLHLDIPLLTELLCWKSISTRLTRSGSSPHHFVQGPLQCPRQVMSQNLSQSQHRAEQSLDRSLEQQSDQLLIEQK